MMSSLLKKIGYIWKRMRKSLKEKQDRQGHLQKKKQLDDLIKLAGTGFIDLYFGDESGFNCEGYIPYSWQPKGQYLHIVPAKTKPTQVFGMLSLSNTLEAYSLQNSIDSKSAIAVIDDFCKRIKKRTVLVLDNAPIHKSKLFSERIKKWAEEDLEIFFLPKYSPHLNPIEILWKKMKYEWIDYTVVESQDQLDEQIENIIKNYGRTFVINFAE